MQDVNNTHLFRLALRMQRHEGYDYKLTRRCSTSMVFAPIPTICGRGNAIMDLLLEDEARFAQAVPALRKIHHSFSEFLTFFNSGGVTAKTGYLPLPMPASCGRSMRSIAS